MTSEQSIKTPEVRFDRRVSFFVRFLREAVQHMAALAGGSFHLSIRSTEMPRRSSVG
jgi:hypothetical protein